MTGAFKLYAWAPLSISFASHHWPSSPKYRLLSHCNFSHETYWMWSVWRCFISTSDSAAQFKGSRLTRARTDSLAQSGFYWLKLLLVLASTVGSEFHGTHDHTLWWFWEPSNNSERGFKYNIISIYIRELGRTIQWQTLHIYIVTCYTMQKSCFHRAVPKRADESRRNPKWAERRKGRNVYTSLLRNGWLHTLRD
jgi:hypothetical protein